MFGSANERFLKGLGKDVDAINALEPSKVRNFPYIRFSPPQGHSRCRGRVKRKVEPPPPAAFNGEFAAVFLHQFLAEMQAEPADGRTPTVRGFFYLELRAVPATVTIVGRRGTPSGADHHTRLLNHITH